MHFNLFTLTSHLSLIPKLFPMTSWSPSIFSPPAGVPWAPGHQDACQDAWDRWQRKVYPSISVLPRCTKNHSLQLQLYQECPAVQEDPSALSQLFSVCSLLALHKTREIILVELSLRREDKEHQEDQMTNTRLHHIHNQFYTTFYPSIKLHLAISKVSKTGI